MTISLINRRMRKVPIRLRYRDGSKVLAVLPLPYTRAVLPLVIACGRTLFRPAESATPAPTRRSPSTTTKSRSRHPPDRAERGRRSIWSLGA
jgi:hypothetical protein